MSYVICHVNDVTLQKSSTKFQLM